MKQTFILMLSVFGFFSSMAQASPQGLLLNTQAPDFTATDQNGKEISLKNLQKNGPVVVVFYRGNWCPYCNKELKKLQDSLDYITTTGAQVIAVSPEAGEGINKTIAKTGVRFSILHDQDVKIARIYDVSYEVDEKTRAKYLENWNVDFLKINQQQEKAFLPVPAVYIINRKGNIIYRYFNTDITKRPFVKDLLDALKSL